MRFRRIGGRGGGGRRKRKRDGVGGEKKKKRGGVGGEKKKKSGEVGGGGEGGREKEQEREKKTLYYSFPHAVSVAFLLRHTVFALHSFIHDKAIVCDTNDSLTRGWGEGAMRGLGAVCGFQLADF